MRVNNFNSDEKILKYQDKLDYFFNGHKTLVVAELDLTNKCNHKCPGCCGSKDNGVELGKVQIDQIIDGLVCLENKGVILSGGGEPTISPHFEYAVETIKKAGMKIGLNSNGLSLNERKCELIADNCEYFRVSLDAGTPEMFLKTHGMKEEYFYKTLKNIEKFAEIKQRRRSKTSFGVGFLTNSATVADMGAFVKLVRDSGADFAQFRPFIGDTLDVMPLVDELKQKYENGNFKIVASFQKYRQMNYLDDRGYEKCRGMFFSTVITADFKVFACLHFRQSSKHMLGDLSKTTLEEIWKSPRIREVYESIRCSECPILCRNDSFNKTLDKLSLDIVNSEFL